MSNIIILDYSDGSVWVYDIKEGITKEELSTWFKEHGFYKESQINWMMADDIVFNDYRQWKPLNNNQLCVS